MSRIYSDPTANTAIANVIRSQRKKERREREKQAQKETPSAVRAPQRRPLPTRRKDA